MASYTRLKVTQSTIEYRLKSPTTAAEVMSAIAAAKTDLSGKQIADNTIQVRATDESIIVFYRQSQTVGSVYDPVL